MEKRIKYSQFQQVKNAAKMIDPLKRKMQPLEEKIKRLAAEYKGYKVQIEALEAGIVQIVGFHVDELVKKVIEPNGKFDKDGKPLKDTKYVPTDIVTYDADKKEYVISVPEPPTTEGLPGSDYDVDAENVQQEAAHEEEETAEQEQPETVF